MPSKLRKPSKIGGLAKGAAGIAASFIPGGGLLKAGLGLAAKGFGAKAAYQRNTKKSRRKSAIYYLKKIPVEKAKARLTKIKMSAYKGL